MKRINILFTTAICAIFVACSKPSLQSTAVERFKVHFNDIFEGRYASINIKDSKMMFSGDSICIYQYTAVVKNHTGKIEEQRMEYVLVWTRSTPSQLKEFTYPIGGSSGRALQDDLVRTNDIFGAETSKDDPNYEKYLRTEIELRHILDPEPFKRTVAE